MHPLSFYDLQAHYVYTPLHGPFSLFEALEGLLFYPLDELRDSIAIGSKRTLRHELIFELSNVVDDLQEYLLYFSSEFLISPLNLPDFIKELRAGYGRFEHLTVYWGALISRLTIARGIIEHNFWPHLFHPAGSNPAALQGLGRHPSFVSPNMELDESSTSTIAFIPSTRMDSAPRSTCSLSELECLPPNIQSECPPTMPSKIDPMGGKGDHTSSRMFNSTPMLCGSYAT